MKGVVTQVTELTPTIKSLHVNVPGRPSYKPGQFIVVTVQVGGRPLRRAYSLVSAPHWENIEIMVKRHPGGRVSPLMHALRVGDEVELQMPYGRFFVEDHDLPEKMVFLAGDVGLSAVLGILRHLEFIGYKGEMTLIYTNHSVEDVAYRDELNRLARDAGLRLVYSIDHSGRGVDWDGGPGPIDEDLIRQYCDVERSRFFLHGPPRLVAQLVQSLEHLGVPRGEIRVDQW
ncbi:hypothetical protein JXA12_01610 [Candidatus Woesearchaeota archaeon]|nr:hypothetical protein [Candidatus Woesearchaeota archaeon]